MSSCGDDQLKNTDRTHLSPSLLAKLRIRNTIKKMRYRSPQLQEVLRQRCRERMKEKRGQIFNRRRLGLEIASNEVESTLTHVMCQEIHNIVNINWPVNHIPIVCNTPLDEEEAFQLEAELGKEEEQWIFQEYERMLQDEIEWLESLVYENTKEVICPICQKCTLTKAADSINCTACGLRLTNCSDLQTVKELIEDCVSRHSTSCNAVPGFTMLSENENNSLYMTCEDCSSLTFVV